MGLRLPAPGRRGGAVRARKKRRGRLALGALCLVLLGCGGMAAAAGPPGPVPWGELAQAPGRAAGIWGWGLIGAGFFGVALTAARPPKPPKKRRLVPVAGALPRPIKLGRSPYTAPPGRRYQRGSRRRQ